MSKSTRTMNRQCLRLIPMTVLLWGVMLASETRGQADSTSLPARLPRFPRAVTEPPEWLATPVPFDLRSYLSAPSPERNGANHYLLAMKDMSSSTNVCFDPRDLRSKERVAQREQAIERIYLHFTLYSRFDSMDVKRTLVAELNTAFKRVETAQQLARTVFESDLEANPPHLRAALVAAKAYLIKTCVDAREKDLERCIENVTRTLRLARDVVPRGGVAAAQTAVLIEDIVSRKMIPIILLEKHETRPSYCDRLIQIILDHREQRPAIGKIAVANEWLQIQMQLKEWDIESRRMEKLQQDSLLWFNQSYIAIGKPPRERNARLKTLYRTLIEPHGARFEIRPLDRLLWSDSVIQTQLDLVIALCAVRRHYMTSLKFPGSLEKVLSGLPVEKAPQDRLRADRLKNVPIQALFGGDFAVIYSVGVDGKDGEAKQGSDDLAIRIETGGMIEFLYDPMEEIAKPIQ